MDPTVIAAVVGLLGAFITGLLTYLTTRSKGKVDVQATLNAGFTSLVEQLKAERGELAKERLELRVMIQAQDDEILDLKRRIEKLLLVTTTFHNFIVTNNMIPPPFEPGDILGPGSNSDIGK